MLPYLFWDLLLGISWFILFIHRKDLRREILYTSLLMTPLGLTQPMFVPHYWHPEVILKVFGVWDIESLLWCFFTGGIVAVLFEISLGYKHRHKTMKGFHHHAHIIYLSLVLFSFLGLFIYVSNVIPLIRGLFLITIILTMILWFIRHDLILKSIASGLLFTVFYAASLIIVNQIFPDFTIGSWNAHAIYGYHILNIPLEEYLYAFLFGLSWSIIYDEVRGRILFAKK